jgi:glyoxylase-like metal-dependent hydrolase (beta-lactamase superfamily II)
MKIPAIALSLPLLLAGCASFHKQVVMFQEKTTTFNAGKYSIHVISDYYSKAYLIESADSLVLVDTGAQGNTPKILEEIGRARGKKLTLIFITHGHFDHYANERAVRDATGAPICVHRADAKFMENGETPLAKARKLGLLMRAIFPIRDFIRPTPKTKPDVLAVDGTDLNRFGINAKVVHLPGHTPGSSMLLLDEKLAFVGDLLSNPGKVRLQDLYADSWTDISNSFVKLKALDPGWVFPGHGRYFEGARLAEAKDPLAIETNPREDRRLSAAARKPVATGKVGKERFATDWLHVTQNAGIFGEVPLPAAAP